MHPDQLDVDAPLVRRLLAAQFPQWAELPLEPVEPAGTDNAIYRLGEDLVVRLPSTPRTEATLEKERTWLPKLAPHLPLAVPVPVAEGAHNFFRGEPLAERDAEVRRSLAALRDEVDVRAVTALWEAALAAPAWQRPPVWIHGDLDARNLLVERGRLSAVIDFGSAGVGDPACDVMVAWKVLSADSRERFRGALSIDDATWERGRGWALSQGLGALAYYTPETNPVLVREARRWLPDVLAD